MLVLETYALNRLSPSYSYSASTTSDFTGVIDITIVENPVESHTNFNVYWDLFSDWDGESGELNVKWIFGYPSDDYFISSTEVTTGDYIYIAGGNMSPYAAFFIIPSGEPGDHYIWLQNTDTGQTWMIGSVQLS